MRSQRMDSYDYLSAGQLRAVCTSEPTVVWHAAGVWLLLTAIRRQCLVAFGFTFILHHSSPFSILGVVYHASIICINRIRSHVFLIQV